MHRALVVHHPGGVELLPLPDGAPAVVVGRSPPSDVVLACRGLSRQHARFEVRDGGVWVVDLGSTNGTLVNGVRHDEARVGPRDRVTLGPVRVTLYQAGRAPERDVVPPVVEDPAMRRIHNAVARVADAPSSVLLVGPTGSGRRTLAERVHAGTGRPGPLVRVDCAQDPATLREALLGRQGALARPHGTLILHDVDRLPEDIQATLLHVLEIGQLETTASQRVDVDVRVVSTTAADPAALCDAGAFRRDLLHRLGTVTLHIPPLRERPAEIPVLARRFLEEQNAVHQRRIRDLSPAVLELLACHPWPGNVAELRSAIAHGVALATGDVLLPHDLPRDVREGVGPERSDLDLKERVAELEVRLITAALRSCQGNRSAAAALLGMPRRTLQYKMRSHGLGKQEPAGRILRPAFDASGRPLDFAGRVEALERQLVAEALDRAETEAEAARLLGIQARTLTRKRNKLE